MGGNPAKVAKDAVDAAAEKVADVLTAHRVRERFPASVA